MYGQKERQSQGKENCLYKNNAEKEDSPQTSGMSKKGQTALLESLCQS